MTGQKLIISPKTRIGELLEAYPQLEPVLISMSPVFEKLKNPVLRRTVARVATIQQVSVVGGIPVETIVKRLREEVGQTDQPSPDAGEGFEMTGPPSWFDENKITERYDATPVINSGESPMNEVLRKANLLASGKIMELQTPFIPAPILEVLKGKGFLVFTTVKNGMILSYILKS